LAARARECRWPSAVRTAIVYSNGDNAASIALYESVGFRMLTRNYYYSKRL